MSVEERYLYTMATQIDVCLDVDKSFYSNVISKNANQIEQIWNDINSNRSEKPLFNGSIVSVTDIENNQDQIIIHGHAIEYKHYLAQRHGVDLGIVPLAISGVTWYERENEKQIIVGKRSAHVTQYPECYELVPSGSVDVPSNFIDQAKSELIEEIGIKETDIHHAHGFCVIDDTIGKIVNIGVDLKIDNPQSTIANKDEYMHLNHIVSSKMEKFLNQENIVEMMPCLMKAWRQYHG